jgi:hypothetical protein
MYRREGGSEHFVRIAGNAKKIGNIRFNMGRRLERMLLTRYLMAAVKRILGATEFEGQKPYGTVEPAT